MKKTIPLAFLSCLFFSLPFISKGQYISTTYYMQNLPQSTLLNPAIQPGCNFFMSFAGLSMDVNNSAVSFNDVIYKHYNEEADLFYTPLDSLATQQDKDDFLANFKDLNTLSTAFNVGIFGMGFRVEDNYFTFHIAERFYTNMDYPVDMIDMMINGNGEPGTYNWSGLGGRMTAYQEIALSYSRKASSYLTYGIRGKLLFGQLDFGISKQEVLFDVDTFGIDITSSFELNGSAPFVTLSQTNGELDSLTLDDLDASILTSLLLGKRNLGFGIDLGVNYNVNDRFGISASVLDLGLIRWKRDVFNLTNDGEFTFEGMELNIIGDDTDTENDTATFFNEFADSLKNTFALSTSNNPYSTHLTAKILLGVNYKVHDRVDFGLLASTEIYRMKFFPRVTLSANFRPFRFINTSFSYSVLNKEYYNLGFGLSFKPGPFNWYVIGDTFPMVVTKGTPMPIHSKGFRIQAGFNLVFGCKKKDSGENDMPLMSY